MNAPDLHTLLRQDARAWPDHTDYWRFGPICDRLTIPPVLARATSALGCALFACLGVHHAR